MPRHLLTVAFAILTVCGAAAPLPVVALPAGHVPVYLIPFAKNFVPSASYPWGATVATVITITRVSGTAACEISVDWRDDSGALNTTTVSILSPPTASSQNVGETDTHCSNGYVPTHVVNCRGAISRLDRDWYQGKAIVGAKSPCTANNLAVDARVIYLSDDAPNVPAAIHSLKVLKPYSLGNKGD